MTDNKKATGSSDASDEIDDAATGEDASSTPTRILLVSYPKLVFLYPSVVVAIFCGFYMAFFADPVPQYAKDVPEEKLEEVREDIKEEGVDVDNIVVTERGHDSGAYWAARIFLVVTLVNLVVIAFDFPRTTSLTWFFAITALVVGLWALFRLKPDLVPAVGDLLLKIQPFANATFYFLYSLGMLLLYGAVFLSRRFDYWEVRPNELLHHHGFLSDLERFSAPHLRIDKEINDVFEYVLLRSGRLILHPSQERRAIVLENVFFINKKEEKITKMLGALQVQVRQE